LENPSHIKNLVKIGMTQKAPEERAKEISSGTGVPDEFNLIRKSSSIYQRIKR
jgi:hypothetical protein